MKDIEGETRGGQENTYRKNVPGFRSKTYATMDRRNKSITLDILKK